MMKNRAIRGATGALVLACLLLLGDSVFAGDGDYDFDFDVDADDFAYWGSCMTVPDSGDLDPFSPCAAFDFDNDNDVDNYDFGAFQAAYQKPVSPCKPIKNALDRAYVRAAKIGHNILGATALISSKATTLCPDPAVAGLSAAWVDMVHAVPTEEDPEKFEPDVWAQMGHLHSKWTNPPPQPPTEFWFVYTETGWGDTNNERELIIAPGGAGTPPAQPWQTYKSEKTSTADGFVTYFLDSALFHRYEGDKWENKAGRIDYVYAAEIMHYDDQMVGTEANPCLFSACMWKKNLHEWLSADIAPGDLKSSNENYWGKNWLSPQAFNVFDKGAP